nr:hypothetical protein BaRGS_020624 [Batillaria attramentaria]
MYAKNMLKSVKENLVVYGVESCGKIQQRENRNFTIIKRQQVIHYFQECSFSGVTEAGHNICVYICFCLKEFDSLHQFYILQGHILGFLGLSASKSTLEGSLISLRQSSIKCLLPFSHVLSLPTSNGCADQET